MQKRWGIRIPS